MNNIPFIQAANFDIGRYGQKIEAVVIHIASGTYNGTISWFQNPKCQASAHFVVSKNGDITQCVKEEDFAWGNGCSWKGNQVLNVRGVACDMSKVAQIVKDHHGINPNTYTISIEHEGNTGEPWTDAMYEADRKILQHLHDSYGLILDRYHVIGHFEIDTVDRANCPGTGFSFDHLLNLLTNSPMGNTPDVYNIKSTYQLFSGETLPEIWETFSYKEGDPILEIVHPVTGNKVTSDNSDSYSDAIYYYRLYRNKPLEDQTAVIEKYKNGKLIMSSVNDPNAKFHQDQTSISYVNTLYTNTLSKLTASETENNSLRDKLTIANNQLGDIKDINQIRDDVFNRQKQVQDQENHYQQVDAQNNSLTETNKNLVATNKTLSDTLLRVKTVADQKINEFHYDASKDIDLAETLSNLFDKAKYMGFMNFISNILSKFSKSKSNITPDNGDQAK